MDNDHLNSSQPTAIPETGKPTRQNVVRALGYSILRGFVVGGVYAVLGSVTDNVDDAHRSMVIGCGLGIVSMIIFFIGEIYFLYYPSRRFPKHLDPVQNRNRHIFGILLCAAPTILLISFLSTNTNIGWIENTKPFVTTSSLFIIPILIAVGLFLMYQSNHNRV